MKRTQKQIIEQLETKVNRVENCLADLAVSNKCVITGDDLNAFLKKYRIVVK